MPLANLSAIARLRPITLGKSTLTFSNVTPCEAASARTFRMNAPSSSSALVGMQPQFKQVPPRFSRSTQRTFFLSCPARIAGAYRAGPPPMTRMSYSYLPGVLVGFAGADGDGAAAGLGAAVAGFSAAG